MKKKIEVIKEQFVTTFSVPEELKKFCDGCIYLEQTSLGNKTIYFRVLVKKQLKRIYVKQNQEKIITIFPPWDLVSHCSSSEINRYRNSGYCCNSTSLSETLSNLITELREKKKEHART